MHLSFKNNGVKWIAMDLKCVMLCSFVARLSETTQNILKIKIISIKQF